MPNWGPQPVLKIVDAMSDTANVLLDLNDGVNFMLGAGWSLPLPPLRKNAVPIVFGDGSRYPSSAYENRVLHYPVQVSGGNFERVQAGSFDTFATNVRNMTRLLDRELFFIRWQVPGMTRSLYFRCFRSPQHTYDPSLRAPHDVFDLDIDADPFGYRPVVTLPTVTITNDPAAVAPAKALTWDVTGIEGDVDTPALIVLGNIGDGGESGIHYVLGVRQHGSPSQLDRMVEQAESLSFLGGGVTVVNDAAMSNGQCARISFADANMEMRMSGGAVPGADWQIADQLGLYRVYAIVRNVTALSVFNMYLQHRAGSVSGGLTVDLDAVQYAPVSLSQRQRVDLGVMTLPATDYPTTTGPSGLPVGFDYRTLALYVSRASGTGSLDVDYFALVPCDESLVEMTTMYSTVFAPDIIMDTFQNRLYLGTFAGGGGAVSSVSDNHPDWIGGLPVLVPNQTNRFYLLRERYNAGPTGPYPDVKTDTTTAAVSYWPRYLYAATAAV